MQKTKHPGPDLKWNKYRLCDIRSMKKQTHNYIVRVIGNPVHRQRVFILKWHTVVSNGIMCPLDLHNFKHILETQFRDETTINLTNQNITHSILYSTYYRCICFTSRKRRWYDVILSWHGILIENISYNRNKTKQKCSIQSHDRTSVAWMSN